MSNDLMELSYDNLDNIIKEVTGKERELSDEWKSDIKFHMMYGRRVISGLEISVHDVDWKKSFRRVRSVNGQISISRLKIAYEELREIYDTEIHPKILERERRDNKVKFMNETARSLKNASVVVYHDSSLRRGLSITVEGGEDLIEDCLSFLEQRCG